MNKKLPISLGREINRICRGCNKVMGLVRSNRKTCDDRCRQKWYRDRQREAKFEREYPLLAKRYEKRA